MTEKTFTKKEKLSIFSHSLKKLQNSKHSLYSLKDCVDCAANHVLKEAFWIGFFDSIVDIDHSIKYFLMKNLELTENEFNFVFSKGWSENESAMFERLQLTINAL